MSKKFGKILSFVLALVMVCSLLPMSVMAAENAEYTVTFAPGNLCLYNGEGAYPTSTYDNTTDTFLLPDPTTLNLVGRSDTFVFQGWTLEGGDGTYYNIGENVADKITGDVTFYANYMETGETGSVTYTIKPGSIGNDTTNLPMTNGPIPQEYVTEISLPATDELIHNDYGWVIPEDLTFARWEKQDGTVISVDTEMGRTVSFLPKDGDEYTAFWDSKTVTTYTVTLHPGTAGDQAVSGPDIPDGSYTAGTEYYGPATVPYTHIGYRSTGWSYNDGGEPITFPITVDNNIDLYALWEENVAAEYWTVTLHAGEGATFQEFVTGYENITGNLVGEAERGIDYNIALPGAYDTAIVERVGEDGKVEYVEENATFATIPDGMEFAGWKVDDAEVETIYYSGELITVCSDITLTAQWRTKGEGPYKLIFDAGVLSNLTFLGVEYVNRAVDIDIPVHGEYVLPTDTEEVKALCGWNVPAEATFEKWVDGSNTEITVRTISDMSADLRVVAVWNIPTQYFFIVSFTADGGEGEMPLFSHATLDENGTYTYTIPDCAFTPPKGKVFGAWVNRDGDEEEYYFPGDTYYFAKPGHLTLTTVWLDEESPNFTNG